jgi:2-polyprenyl-3-methyl-5-hydroxy-6-metoxy-1,4-benzoquinol methylase
MSDTIQQQNNMQRMYSLGLSGILHCFNTWLFSRRINCYHEELLLDVGCGDGLLLRQLQKRYGCRVYGIDADKRMAEITFAIGINCDVGDAESVVWPKDCDMIIFSGVLHHIENPEAMIDKAKASLKAGGQLIIREIADTWAMRFLRWTGKRKLWLPILRTHQESVAILESDYVENWLSKWGKRKEYLLAAGFVIDRTYRWWTFEETYMHLSVGGKE